MKIHVNARDHAHYFDIEEGEKILYAGLGSAIDLPYECGSGTCGTCKARLVSGEIDDVWPEAPGRKYLKRQDEFLMCQCTAKSDLTIEVAGFVQTMGAGSHMPAYTTGQISTLEFLTSEVIYLQIELDRAWEFDAGQFAMIQIPGIAGFRGWSMVNFQHHAEKLDFIVKKKPGGALTEWLFNSQCEGTKVELFGPLGRAIFYPSLAKNILCVAGGSGIAGMVSILSCAAQNNYFKQYTGDVFFGVQTMKDIFFLQELSRLRELCGDSLNITVALSKEDAPIHSSNIPSNLTIERGLVHEVAASCMSGRYANVRAYLAGPPPMVDAAIRVLILAGVTTDNICYDKFS